MPKSLHRKIRVLEESITRDMNPALERAERTKSPEDQVEALRKVETVIANAQELRLHVLQNSVQMPAAGATP